MLTKITKIFLPIICIAIFTSHPILANPKDDKPIRHTIRINGSQNNAKISPSIVSLKPNKSNLIIIRNTTSRDRGVRAELVPNITARIQGDGFVESAENYYLVDDKGEASLTIRPTKAVKLRVKLES